MGIGGEGDMVGGGKEEGGPRQFVALRLRDRQAPVAMYRLCEKSLGVRTVVSDPGRNGHNNRRCAALDALFLSFSPADTALSLSEHNCASSSSQKARGPFFYCASD